MSIWNSKILYVFLTVSSYPKQKRFIDEVLGFPIVENEYHPPHSHHGVIKYDAGDVILSLNIAQDNFNSSGFDGIKTFFSTGRMREAKIYAEMQIAGYLSLFKSRGSFIDFDNHEYGITEKRTAYNFDEQRLTLSELHFEAVNLQQTEIFYQEVLGLIPLEKDEKTISFATGNVKLVFNLLTDVSKFPFRKDSYLSVFHTAEIEKTFAELSERGLIFDGKVVYSDIGGAVRFFDPSGHCFCLYQPSAESLLWKSGEKVKEIIEKEENLIFGKVFDDLVCNEFEN